MSQNTTAMQCGAGGETTGATDMTTQQPGFSMSQYASSKDLFAAMISRITELESQLAQRFDAADMATASAQGFRDGVAAAPAQPAAQQGAAYAEMPTSSHAGLVYEEGFLIGTCPLYTADKMRAFADATHTLRASHGQAPADAAPSAGAVAGPDDIDAIALTRYKVVPAHESMFHRFAVVAGDGKQQLYLGREVECENMAQKFAGAFLDGAFYQANITPSTQAADSVQEDAARLDFLIEQRAYVVSDPDACPGHWLHWARPDGRTWVQGDEHPTPRAAIDAARKQGARWQSAVRALTLHI